MNELARRGSSWEKERERGKREKRRAREEK